MLAVIRLRGTVEASKNIRNTLESMGLKRVNNMIIVDKKMEKAVKMVNSYVAWGEVDSDLMRKFEGQKVIRLNSPKGEFKSKKRFYPKGDLGYRGSAINELIKKMII
jgi:ribosomal protein L30/L7E